MVQHDSKVKFTAPKIGSRILKADKMKAEDEMFAGKVFDIWDLTTEVFEATTASKVTWFT